MSTTLSRAEMEAKLLSDATGANDEAPPMQWIRPLVEFLGDSEPLDDDECDWIIRGILPRGEPALIAGAPKCGKTWLALDVAICAATGRGWLGFDNTLGRPAKVLVAAYEDKQSRLAQRIYWLARGHGIDRFEFESTLAITQLPLKLPGSEMLSKLSAELNRWQADVVIIDSLSRVMHGDQNSTQDMTLFTADWLELCRAAGTTVLFLHHTRKEHKDSKRTGAPRPEEIRGSGDLVATARSLITLASIGEGEQRITAGGIFGNLAPGRDEFAFALVESFTDSGQKVVTLQSTTITEQAKGFGGSAVAKAKASLLAAFNTAGVWGFKGKTEARNAAKGSTEARGVAYDELLAANVIGERDGRVVLLALPAEHPEPVKAQC